MTPDALYPERGGLNNYGISMEYEAEQKKLKDRLLAQRRKEDTLLPSFISDALVVERNKLQGFQIYRLIPERPRGNIFYLYSSRRMLPISKREWQFILTLCKKSHMAVTVPLYPIAPEYDCEDVFDLLLPAYRDFCRHREPGPLIIMGCGAGAGLGLSLSLLTWKEGLPDPDKLAFLSPEMDTEYFDQELESKVRRDKKEAEEEKVRREFIDSCWVKNYAGRTEYTSPIYAEFTDICKDILVVSGTGDPENPYARRFTEKVLDTGIEVKYFEYPGMAKDFYFRQGSRESRHVMKVLHDLLLDTDTAIMHQYLQEVRDRAEWSKRFPELFRDEEAIRYVSQNPGTAVSEFHGRNVFSLLEAATQRAADDAVSLFLKEYPNGTVVYIGCSLDTMLSRVDNHRVLWYDLDSPGKLAARSIYTKRRERERRIDRSLNDLSWMSQLSVEMDRGLLFVVRNIFSYMTREEMKNFLNRLYQSFQGCNVIFDIPTPRARRMLNFFTKRSGAEYRRRRLAMRDPRRDIELMNPVFNVISVKSVLDDVRSQDDWRFSLRLGLWSNRRRESRKMIHIRLGNERYKTFEEL